jgi:hypothetical protein
VHHSIGGVDYGIHPKMRSRLNSERQESPFPSPQLSRSASKRIPISPLASEESHIHHGIGVDYGIHPKTRSRLNSETQESPFPSPRLSKSISRNYKQSPLALEVTNSSSLERNNIDPLEGMRSSSVEINDKDYMDMASSEHRTSKPNHISSLEENYDLTITERTKCQNTKAKAWKTLFKNPVFYKVRKLKKN